MGEAVGPMLASAVGIAISPLTLVAVILILATPRGRANGLAFACGWVVGLAAMVAVVVAAGSGPGAGDATPSWSSWLKLALGVLLVLMAGRQWRDRPREGHITAPPPWMRTVDRLTPGRSAALAVVLAVADPKNLVLAVGGAASIAASTGGDGGKAVAAALMVLVGSLCTLVPLGVRLLGGGRSARALGEWKAWMATHNAAITTTVLAVLGAEYVGDAITGLTRA
ncbi:threonine/homoserine/homoserine lactone efflux protein [Kitasatospora sp. MAA19]|uniref:GAP family protein n=1 Tax=Kitasatospora sp. MAA19 TaxID=3035090 RepID=UPI0024769E72|nr:GAP family protein [Kitasatospora sp. MAA19]MDH6707411.1 threonine/homoserine/homoserine lactone efflux protein [Kitasatospora sp. MAA19]